MRVTESMIYNSTKSSLAETMAAVQSMTEKVSSGKQLNRPSDNPADTRSAVNLHDTLSELNQFLRNIDNASSKTSAADTAMGSAGDLLQRASELAIQGANGTLSASDRQAMAQEVSQLIEAMAQDAGAKVGDEYIFSGFRTDKPPFTVTGPGQVSAYQGDDGVILSRIGTDSTMQVNVTADQAFAPGIAALTQLQADLQSGQAVQQTTIGRLGDALESLLAARAQVGARANRLNDAKDSQQALVTSNQALLSQLEDADMPAVITELTKRQTTYQASLMVASKVMQTSLIDYLR
jgi:flagellar hook-associated protein 3 FlgL